MRKAGLVVGEYYHIYNRGVEKRTIFLDQLDYWRFMALLIGFQGDIDLNPMSRFVNLVKLKVFNDEIFQEIIKEKYVELISFCLMHNHFHLILHEIKEGGISKFMQRLSNSYTKYFNARYNRNGHLFNGGFQSSHINSDEYLKYLSAYIHLNPDELRRWHKRTTEYPWSSFQDYAGENRWGEFLNSQILMDQFNGGEEYRHFIEETSISKIERKLQQNVEHSMFNT
ncbi:hypothetical protein A3I27_03525 [Candidatus Giovannonibacteria bacterium RIFCSPLOWO2_02_FULL_43_11b]|uniref:Transposase IS200-like domain-containing protein n=1 Tax=Candidatus Giovannonibacteria bacterium RIFCSPHIGHO2_12_FULL_43_15 TaxID=1798341 RepID=A0A1F5WQ20_9BACT|nr:MAG: hypothetical protein A2739_03190 [Candidatus Giovannonibacteria bacterium RIFCSPHIGHO2_01_FULL_43_100]OGF66361.1 MAG: hypothetical protein A3B97_03045 [Candidatus Giovannonibacteria bacterium RIFCSPHIGHO2_02_FULL_43_32]OGF77720.1 MAG: hypothetical protein A3F23_01520 [Candidatus Giovannonibacteria bacterium RIFCSPHIGHO2_12_FULL_43_15]OGF78061.1 MAG: hypothetical protein A3A15_01875 [Candidatus Giovannonibacteria bacterium RIFCSPLOWO2_01_FULL_43_60]OGF89326.1 MAG: hypothetical protein A3